jgi:hypothetical protein
VPVTRYSAYARSFVALVLAVAPVYARFVRRAFAPESRPKNPPLDRT